MVVDRGLGGEMRLEGIDLHFHLGGETAGAIRARSHFERATDRSDILKVAIIGATIGKGGRNEAIGPQDVEFLVGLIVNVVDVTRGEREDA